MLEHVKDSVLLLAYHENDLLCADIFTFTKNQGLYYYGASSNVKRNLMAPYLVQWEAIKMAKERGCEYFDFMGIADPANPGDRLAGVTEFKLKFGGEAVKFQAPFHIVNKKLVYSIYKIARRKLS
jgi:lipid II:glycine glycyltransferase (peptidoglycan interpeptide bridge formation enzyme)